jgi:hypothetical protein
LANEACDDCRLNETAANPWTIGCRILWGARHIAAPRHFDRAPEPPEKPDTFFGPIL